MNSEFCFLYVPCATTEEAEALAKTLIEEHLAACVNILPGMRSVYRWEGKLCQESETLLLAKTSRALSEKAGARIQALHGYECPAIVRLDSDILHEPYATWAKAQLK